MTVTDRRLDTVPAGAFVEEDGLEWYRIDGYDLLDPFLVSVVSPTDQWMWVSSSGALTAGRRSARHALFPYETDDRLHRAGGLSGPVTLIRVPGHHGAWEPFADHTPRGAVHRAIAKTVAGDRLMFEERHPALGLTVRYSWATADRFGFVRTCELVRLDGLPPVEVELLDGLADVLPAGVDLADQQTRSTLVDAYRRAELDEPSGLALFTLEALVSDKPEPAESLRASVAWSYGLADPVVALSDRQLRRFRSGEPIEPEHLVTGRKGGYFVSAPGVVEAGHPLRWGIVADVGRDHLDVARLRTWLARTPTPGPEVAAAVGSAAADLIAIVAPADALQQTADRRATAHHFANVLFNVMRGGVFADEHRVAVAAVAGFVAGRNRAAADRFATAAGDLPAVVEIGDLRAAVAGDADLTRLVNEYLPLRFSRRHGDPSRPWNAFDISTEAAGYEGNWRDIFQNWDALVHSYPGFVESVIAKFLDASTVDGHNPYRITDQGVDWEVPEDGSWGNIGYWGDHQVAYLHRLLDAARRFHPGSLEGALGRVCFSYADAPYRIRPYDDIVRDPKHTIEFDKERHDEVARRVAAIGADGQLVPAAGGGIHHASLAEKLLVPALAKLSNFVAGAGIWMNTQRPEWNDANNALVGNGVSVVTLLHLREYLGLFDDLLAGAAVAEVPIGHRVAGWLAAVQAAFAGHDAAAATTPEGRRALLDDLGRAFASYRAAAYDHGPGTPTPVPVAELRELVAAARPHLDVAANEARRPDGLVDAYRLVVLEPGAARLETLPEMLEGQVAALAAADMEPASAVEVVDAMFASDLYRPDQRTFLLYPDRRPPPFLAKNAVPDRLLGPTALALLDGDSGVLRRDEDGTVRFAASFRSAADLAAALDDLSTSQRTEILDLYEAVFRHRAFTGRSGTMYRYEGLGSIYWHMVSKLLFALQERLVAAADAGEDRSTLAALAGRYRRVRAGLGFMKTAAEQGTFPTDPHSHTPAHTGAQQPGMTGQVKEGILLRWGELGVRVTDGRVRFRPLLLSLDEFLTEPRPWPVLGPGGALDPGTLGFTYCGVPVVYHLSDGAAWTRVRWAGGEETVEGDRLDGSASRVLLARRGEIERIDVGVPSAAVIANRG